MEIIQTLLNFGQRPLQLLRKMDIPGCAGVFNYFAGSAFHVLGESSLNSANFLNVTIRQPYGVVALIIPWNVSLLLSLNTSKKLICSLGSYDYVRVQSGPRRGLREHCRPEVS